MFPISVNQQRACEVTWLNYFTICSHTQRSVSSHAVAKDLSSSGLAVFVKQIRAMSKNKLSLLLILEEKRTATHITYLPTTTRKSI